MIKKIFTYILPLLGLAACSDDLEPRLPGQLDSDGTLHLSFGISPMKTVTTRANETQVSEVRMLVYSSATGNALIQNEVIPVTGSDRDYKGQVMLNSAVQADANAKFYFIANPFLDSNNEDLLAEGTFTTPTALSGAKYAAVENGSLLVMSSEEIGKGDITKGETVSLWHNAAKITVWNATQVNATLTGDDDKDYTAGTTKYSFSTFVTTAKSPVMAGGVGHSAASGTAKTTYLGSHDETVSYSVLDNTTTHPANNTEKYVHPTDNSSAGKASKSFIIVKAPFGNKEYYYRLDFQQKVKKAGSDPVEYTAQAIDILPNHHYKFLIKDVKGVGYDSASEAARYPSPMVEYTIHDHSPVIYNMISDGIRELGVEKQVTNPSATQTEATLYVKLFSASNNGSEEVAELLSEEARNSNWSAYFRKSVDWLTIKNVEVAPSNAVDVNGDSIFGDSSDDDPNHEGTIYKVTLGFGNTNNPGTLETDLTVTWHGLSREVKVVWERTFDTSQLFSPSVKLKIFNHPNTTHNWSNSGVELGGNDGVDYFNNFLEKEDQSNNASAQSIGTRSYENNGKPRNVGLHFPMPYGDGTKWSYMYKVTLNNALGNGSSFTWKVSTSGVSNIGFSKNSGGNSNEEDRTFYVYRTKTDDFSYEANGKLIIEITTSDGTQKYDNVAIYHTGFFHKDNGAGVYTDKTPVVTKWNYYEVVSAGGDNTGQDHWLDRNMGATSAQMYIEGGMTTNPEARGYYVNPYQYVPYTNPTFDSNSVPPGYDVPSVTQWNNLKADGAFQMQQVSSYHVPTLTIGDKTVFFQKSQYVEDGEIKGESRAGYYWTSDVASGTEKDEIGNWMKVMCLSGSATSYINGCTKGRGNPYYLSLRPVAKRSGTTNHPEKFGFYVKGATHVFIYVQNDDNTRTTAYTWPGKAIGNYLTANKTFYFSYETTTADLNKIRVIFNYVDKDRIIHTFSNNEFNENRTHTDILPSVAQGWTVFNTDRTTGFSFSDINTEDGKCAVSLDPNGKLNGNLSTNGSTWIVNNLDELEDDDPIPGYKKYRFLWKTGWGVTNREWVYWIRFPEGGQLIDGTPLKKDTWVYRSGYDNDRRCSYIDFIAPKEVTNFEVELIVAESTEWGNQSADLNIKSEKFSDSTSVPGYNIFMYDSTDFGTKQTDKWL